MEQPGRKLRNYLFHLFAPKQQKWMGTMQAEGEEWLWSEVTGSLFQTIISTPVPTNPCLL